MRTTLFLSTLLVFSACDLVSSPGTADADDELLSPVPIDLATLSRDSTLLVGTWDWVASVYYYTSTGEPFVSTPASSDRSESWTFRTDGTATRTENGEVTWETTYRVGRRAYGPAVDGATVLLLGQGDYGETFGTDGSILVLDSTPMDGPQARYRKR